MLRRMCHLRTADLQTQRLIKLQFRDRLCICTRGIRPLFMTGSAARLPSGIDRPKLPTNPASACNTLSYALPLVQFA